MGLVFFGGADADFAEGFQGCGVDSGEVANALFAGHIHYVVILEARMSEGFRTPLTIRQEGEGRAVEELHEAVGTVAEYGKGVVAEGHGEDLGEGVGERRLVADHAGEGKAAELEDEDELEGVSCMPGGGPRCEL